MKSAGLSAIVPKSGRIQLTPLRNKPLPALSKPLRALSTVVLSPLPARTDVKQNGPKIDLAIDTSPSKSPSSLTINVPNASPSDIIICQDVEEVGSPAHAKTLKKPKTPTHTQTQTHTHTQTQAASEASEQKSNSALKPSKKMVPPPIDTSVARNGPEMRVRNSRLSAIRQKKGLSLSLDAAPLSPFSRASPRSRFKSFDYSFGGPRPMSPSFSAPLTPRGSKLSRTRSIVELCLVTETSVFSPNSVFRRWWDVTVFITVLYNVFSVPYFSAFFADTNSYNFSNFSPFVLFLNWFFDVVFWIDIILRARFFQYRDPRTLYVVSKKASITKRYFKGWFSIDVLASFPLDLLSLSWSGTLQAVLDFRFLRLFRTLRVSYFIRRINAFLVSRSIQISNAVFRFFKFVLFMICFSHVIACFWRMLAAEEPGSSWIDSDVVASFSESNGSATYVRCLYWALTTFMTIGYSDIVPFTNPTVAFTSAVIVVGIGFTGGLLANMTSLLHNLDAAAVSYKEKRNTMKRYVSSQSISRHLENRVFDCYTYLWKRQKGLQEDVLLSKFPTSLTLTMKLGLCEDIISSVFPQDCPQSTITHLVSCLLPRVVCPKGYIYEVGQLSKSCYLITLGEVMITQDDSQYPLTAGNLFGFKDMLHNCQLMFN